MNEESAKLVITIDDEAEVRLLFKEYLVNFGFRVLEAENGKVGIQAIKKHNPDLVLVDLMMPVADGFRVLEYMKENVPNTPIIVISSANEFENVIQAMHLGAWDYMLKPVTSFPVLQHTIDKTIQRADLIRKNIEYQQKLEEAYDAIRYDLEIAHHIQTKLFPTKTLKIGNFLFKHDVFPSHYVSGDFVDYFRINDDYIGFYLADVAGHGVPSALVTVLLKSIVRKYCDEFTNAISDHIINPASLLHLLNGELLQEKLDRYLTIIFGVINCRTDSLIFTNGGHFPLPVLHEKNNYINFQTEDPPVGMFPDQKYHCQERKLPASFQLTMFSDGILEILPQNKLSEKVMFLNSLSDWYEDSYSRFINTIHKNHEELPDDISVLSITR